VAVKTERTEERTTQRPDAGFTLVELMVAIVLLAVGALAVSQVLTQSVAMQTGIELRTTALDVARSYMEVVRVRDPLTLASEPEVRVDESGAENPSGLFTRALTVTSVSDHLMEITVVVTSPRSSPVQLVTLLWDGLV
jgi:prepilin-type N-terminal cleavage/methylation domain-containing protein